MVKGGTIGAASELLAAADLMMKGWEVFRALSPNSHCDLLAEKDGTTMRLEVRTGRYILGSDLRLSYSTRNSDGKFMIVVTVIDKKVHYIGFTP